MDERTDVHADMTKLTVAFRNFAKAPNKGNTQKTCLLVINSEIASRILERVDTQDWVLLEVSHQNIA